MAARVQIHRGRLLRGELRTQAEVDYYWKKLSAGGKQIQCGWLKDKFGLAWQVVPTVLSELVSGQDPSNLNV